MTKPSVVLFLCSGNYCRIRSTGPCCARFAEFGRAFCRSGSASSRSSLASSRAKAERTSRDIDLHATESGRLEASGQSVGIDRDQSIEEVDQAKQSVRQAVRSDESTAGPEHAANFGKQSVLELGRSDVVQHGAGNGTGKTRFSEIQRGRIATQHRH